MVTISTLVGNSVTRFCEISKDFCNILRVYFVFGIILPQLGIKYAIWKTLIVVNGQN